MMEYPLVTQQTENNGQIIIIKPQKWTAAEAAKYASLASELARKSVGATDTMEPLAALQILVQEGWVPDSVLDVAATELDTLRDRIRAAFEGLEDKDTEEEEPQEDG